MILFTRLKLLPTLNNERDGNLEAIDAFLKKAKKIKM